MPLRNYGALRGSVIDHRLASGASAHYPALDLIRGNLFDRDAMR